MKLDFGYNQDHSERDINTGGSRIKRSGAFEMNIKRVEFFRGQGNHTEALTFILENENEESIRLKLFYKDKSGEIIEFNNFHISQLCDLLKINPTQIEIVKDKDEKFHIPILENRIIGIFISYKGIEKYTGNDGNEYENINYFLRGFYDADTGRTIKEIKNNKSEAEAYERLKKVFTKENDQIEMEKKKTEEYKRQQDNFDESIKNSEVDDDDDFPF